MRGFTYSSAHVMRLAEHGAHKGKKRVFGGESLMERNQ
jgi:hypothetical protein